MVNLNKILMLAIFFSISGCTLIKQPAKEVTQNVDVIVYEIPAPPTVVKPVLDITTLTPTSTLGDKTKSMEVTIMQLISYSTDLQVIVDKYKALSNENTSIMDVTAPAASGVMVDIAAFNKFLEAEKQKAIDAVK
jgi:hypothetical protein